MTASQSRPGVLNRIQFSGNTIKLVAIVAMVLDHVAWGFFDTYSNVGIVFHLIGRITAPVMCFMIAEGSEKTRNVNRYTLRLLIFAFVSDAPFMFFEENVYFHNVMFTLLFGLLLIRCWSATDSDILKLVFTFSFCFIAMVMRTDWDFIGVLLCLTFWLFRKNPRYQWISLLILTIVSAFRYRTFLQIGMLLSIPVIRFYSGERGKGGKFEKWFFYLFYPLQFIVLGFLRGANF